MRGVSKFISSVGYFDNTDWVRYDNVDFGSTPPRGIMIQLGVSSLYAGQNIEVRIDSETGPLLGTLTTVSTGGTSIYLEEITTLAQGTTGVHAVYLVGKGTVGIATIDKFKFSTMACD